MFLVSLYCSTESILEQSVSYEASRTMLPEELEWGCAAVVNHVQEGGGSDYEPAGSPDLRSKDFAFFFAHSIVPASHCATGEITNSLQ